MNLSVPNHDESVTYSDADQVAPITYVPARNTIFLSYALAVAEVTQASAIIIGVSSVIIQDILTVALTISLPLKLWQTLLPFQVGKATTYPLLHHYKIYQKPIP